MSFLNVSGVCKEGRDFQLKDINFTQQSNQKLAIAGATGSGKSTLLKIIAGLEQADAGQVYFEERRVKGPFEKLMPGHPDIVYLSQYFELRHHYTVEEVLSYVNQLASEEAHRLYKVCRIDHLLNRKTDQLSGGEQQRVALARLLSTAPKLLLLDEPFSNLDMIHKEVLKSVINDISHDLNITCILVSHDPLDTLSWADEMLVMKEGRIIQQGSPQQIYLQPQDEYVAALFGKYNLLTGEQAKFFFESRVEHDTTQLMVRPEQFRIVGRGEGVMAQVTKLKFFGSYCEIDVAIKDFSITIRTQGRMFSVGEPIWITLAFRDISVIMANE